MSYWDTTTEICRGVSGLIRIGLVRCQEPNNRMFQTAAYDSEQSAEAGLVAMRSVMAGMDDFIINDPSILLADEPTGNLDGAMAVEVMEILQAINLRGTTVLVATHDAALMQRFPYRRIGFRGGRLEQS